MKYLGLGSAKELEGRRVKTTRELKNFAAIVPAGAKGNITGFVRDGHISIIIDQCKCCGVKPMFTRLNYQDLELVEDQTP